MKPEKGHCNINSSFGVCCKTLKVGPLKEAFIV